MKATLSDEIAAALRSDLTSGRWGVGMALPSVDDLRGRYRDGPIMAIDANGISGSFDVDPANVTVTTESGPLSEGKYSVSVRQKQLLLMFGKGFSIIVR